MGRRRSKYTRPEYQITAEWLYQNPLTTKEQKILKFVHTHNIVTSKQIARMFWYGKKKSQDLCNRKLRKLFDLHFIDRFFPQANKGSSLQHVTLGKAGAKVLGVRYNPRNTLPITYRHTVYMAEFRILAREYGWSWGITEHNLGPIRCDIYYPERKAAVEIDLGTEGLRSIREKAKRYSLIGHLNEVVMVTLGSKERLAIFLEQLPFNRKAGAQFENIHELFRKI